jgi:hypothetical protein
VKSDAVKLEEAMWMRRKVGGKDVKPDFSQESYLLVYNAVEIQPTFLSNMSPPSSESKNKPVKK